MTDRVLLMNSVPAPLLAGITDPLDLRNIDDRAFRQILESCRAEHLNLYHLTVTALDGIHLLRTVTDLSLEWAPKVTTLSPVFRMTWLERLAVINLPRVVNLRGIETLSRMKTLRLCGGMWRPLRIASLRPLASLDSLTSLTIRHIRIADDDITPLSRLEQLTELELSNEFDRGQVAFLARHLNSRLKVPLSACCETSLACSVCGAPRFMFTGRRMPFLCRSCDSARFKRLTYTFERLVDSA